MAGFNAAEAAAQDAGQVPPAVTLADVVDAATRMRECQHRIADLEQQLKDEQARFNDMRMRELPDLVAQAQTDRVGVPALGNHLPPCDLVVRPYYKANIEAGWAPERREAAFTWLEDEGHGDVIARSVVVSFKRGQSEDAARLRQILQAEGFGKQYRVDKSVPWATLTALVKELHTQELEASGRGEDVEPLPLEKLGATVGMIAELKERSTAPRRAKV